MIKHEGDKWLLYTADGSKVLGTHDTEEDAMAQEQAIEATKHRAAEGGVRHLHLRGALGAVRTEQYDGREHLVVPVVALMDGVIHAVNASTPERVTMATLAKAAHSWNGRPLVLGHPTKGGRQCSANDPAIEASHRFGTIFNSRMSGQKLLMDAYVDPVRAERLGGAKFLERLRNGEQVEVSVGAFVTTDNTVGNHNGKAYKATWLETVGDHLAFLPNGVGACSIEMGCGAHRAAMRVLGDSMEVDVSEGLKDRALTFLRSLMPRGWGDDEVKQELRDALMAVEPAMRNGEIVRVKNDAVIYCLYPPTPSYADGYPAPPAMTYWSRDYTFDTDTQKFTVSYERQQVEPTTVYAPMRTARKGYEDCPTCKGSGNVGGNPCESCDGAGEMKAAESPIGETLKAACRCEEADVTKTERIAALLKHEHNPVKSQKALEAMDDAELTTLEGHCKVAGELKAAQAKTAADLKAADDKKAAELKVAEEAKKTAEVKLAETVAELKAASEKALSEEEFLKRAPESIRTLVADKKAQDAAAKATLVASLKTAAKGVYSDEELDTMPLPALMKLAQVAKVEPADYSGRGLPMPRAAGEDFTPPDAYADGIKVLQAKATVN